MTKETKSLKEQLIEAVEERQKHTEKLDGAPIEIHGALQRLTAFYERIRTLVDYQEERFIRRLAIRRILFRRLIIQGKRTTMGEALLKELIRAAYLENGKYSLKFGEQIDEILAKYLTALPTIERRYSAKDLISMHRRLIGLAAAEIEDLVDAPTIDKVLINRLSGELALYLEKEPDDETRILATRALFKADAELVALRLFANADSPLTAKWNEFLAEPAKIAPDILRELVKIELALNDNTLEARLRRFKRLVPPYKILADITYQQGAQLKELSSESNRLELALERIINERMNRTAQKLQRSLIHATLYLFLTKVIVGLALEVPYDIAVAGHIQYLPLVINILTPPLLMVMAGMGIRLPSRANTDTLIKRTQALLADEMPAIIEELRLSHGRSYSIQSVYSLFYFALYVVTFGGLIWLLDFLSFNLASVLLFLFFLSVVGFFAFRIRNSANELAVLRAKEGPMMLIFDFLALPFLRVGRLLSSTVRQINVFLFVMDFVIEAPLKVVLVALEDWFAFLREKREELG